MCRTVHGAARGIVLKNCLPADSIKRCAKSGSGTACQQLDSHDTLSGDVCEESIFAQNSHANCEMFGALARPSHEKPSLWVLGRHISAITVLLTFYIANSWRTVWRGAFDISAPNFAEERFPKNGVLRLRSRLIQSFFAPRVHSTYRR
jgi:hypothetical protein